MFQEGFHFTSFPVRRLSDEKWRHRIAQSPVTLLLLVVLTAALAFEWYAINKSMLAPELPGWNWKKHPNTMLVSYRDPSCGCSTRVHDLVAQAISRNLDVVIVDTPQNSAQAEVTPYFGNPKFTLIRISDSDKELLGALSPTGKTSVLHIKNNRIAMRLTGSLALPDAFFE